MYSPQVNTRHFCRHHLRLTAYSLQRIISSEMLQFSVQHRASKYWRDMYGCSCLRLHGSQHGSTLLLSRTVPAIVVSLLLSVGSNNRTLSPTLKERGFARRS